MANQAVGNGIAPGSKYNQDFPALASLYSRPHLGAEPSDEKSSVVGPHTQARRQEFAIHNEDFPALSSTANSTAFPTSQFPPLSASTSNSASTPPLATGATTTSSNSQQSIQNLPSQANSSTNGSSWWSGGSSWSSSTAPSLSTSSQPAFSPSWSSSWASNNTATPSSQSAAGTAPAQPQGPSSWSSWSSLSSLGSNSSTSPKSRPASWPNSWSAPNPSAPAVPSPLPSPSSSQNTPPASSPRSSPASSPTSAAAHSPPNGPGLSYSALSANQPDGGAGQPSIDETGDDSRWGLTGLLSVIRMTHPDLNTLALGTDLTTLGLNLNSTEVLYATFAYPCVENPCRREPDFVLPYCYYMQPPALKTSHLSKFQLETLFYIFYNMPKDTLQVYAAKELFNREWRYHKDLGLWFTRDPSSQAGGSYIYFDINSWERRLYRDNNQTLKFMTEEEHGLL